jgi:hypothetical protein
MISAQATAARTNGCAGSGESASPGAAGLLGLAATPKFAAMALGTAFCSGQMDMICAATGGMPMSGMSIMYALMSVFHVSPWLKLLSNSWTYHGGSKSCTTAA